MNLDSYFIADDVHGEPCIWRENGRYRYPIPVLSKHSLRHDPAVWDLLAAFIKEKP